MILAVDASALVAIGLDEPERGRFLGVLSAAETAWVSPINLVEAGAVLSSWGAVQPDQFAGWLARLKVNETPVSGDAALAAYVRFGRGRHPARLNLGDCFAYALAMQLDAPLLFKGDDFALTDVKRAV